jgi:hypothetical protein
VKQIFGKKEDPVTRDTYMQCESGQQDEVEHFTMHLLWVHCVTCLLSSLQFCSTLASDLAKFGLTESSLYKSLTADLSQVESPEVDTQPDVPLRISQIFSSGGLQRLHEPKQRKARFF